MTTLTLTIPDAQTARVVDAFKKAYGYLATLPNGSPNPETEAQFMRRMIMEFVRDTVRSVEVNVAGDAARIVELAKSPVSVT